MKRTTILATVFSVLGFGAANAEPLRAMQAPPGAMPAYEAVTITRSMGLDPLGGPVWRNGRYVVMATDDDGRELRVVLDAGTGQVIAVRPVTTNYYGPGYGAGYGPRSLYGRGGYAVREDDEVVMTPPRAYPPNYRPDLKVEPAPRQPQLSSRTPATSSVAPAPTAAAPLKKKDTATQSAKVTPTATPAAKPKQADPVVQKHEAPPQATASSQSAPLTTGSGAAEKKEIRKIEIDRKPEDPKPAEAAPSQKSDDVPVNPLL